MSAPPLASFTAFPFPFHCRNFLPRYCHFFLRCFPGIDAAIDVISRFGLAFYLFSPIRRRAFECASCGQFPILSYPSLPRIPNAPDATDFSCACSVNASVCRSPLPHLPPRAYSTVPNGPARATATFHRAFHAQHAEISALFPLIKPVAPASASPHSTTTSFDDRVVRELGVGVRDRINTRSATRVMAGEEDRRHVLPEKLSMKLYRIKRTAARIIQYAMISDSFEGVFFIWVNDFIFHELNPKFRTHVEYDRSRVIIKNRLCG